MLNNNPVIDQPASQPASSRAHNNLYWQDQQLSQFFLIKGAAAAAAATRCFHWFSYTWTLGRKFMVDVAIQQSQRPLKYVKDNEKCVFVGQINRAVH